MGWIGSTTNQRERETLKQRGSVFTTYVVGGALGIGRLPLLGQPQELSEEVREVDPHRQDIRRAVEKIARREAPRAESQPQSINLLIEPGGKLQRH